MIRAALFSRKSDDWETPSGLFRALDDEFNFSIDAAATQDTAKCLNYYGLDGTDYGCHGDALTRRWLAGNHFLNPPYSKVRAFMAKAIEQRQHAPSVVLVPARTDTRWFHDHCYDVSAFKARPGIKLRFLKGRLTFGGATAGAPFPSLIVVVSPLP